MESSPAVPGGEYVQVDRHPLVSLVSACFWVIRTLYKPKLILERITNLCSCSLAAIMGESPSRICYDHCSEVPLFRAFIFYDPYGEIPFLQIQRISGDIVY